MSAHLSTATVTAPALVYDPVAGLHTREISHRPADRARSRSTSALPGCATPICTS